MRSKLVVLLAFLGVLGVNSGAMAGYIADDIYYNDDTGSHIINDSTYESLQYFVDYNISNSPGTQVGLTNGGSARSLTAFNNSSITISGGSVTYDLGAGHNSSINIISGYVGRALEADGNSSITISGGWVGEDLDVDDSATANMTAGYIDEDVRASDDSVITISGGTVGGHFATYNNGTIYLDGTGFQVDGQALSYGDKLSDFVPLVEHRPAGEGIWDFYYGNITGTLADGVSTLDNRFWIYNTGENDGIADIIIVPEPCSLLLFGLAGLVLRRRR